jgi:hypothetical protein
MAVSQFTADELVEKLDKTLLQHKIRRDTMDQIRFRLGTCGICEADTFHERFRALDHAYVSASGAVAAILHVLKEVRDCPAPTPQTGSWLLWHEDVRQISRCFQVSAEEYFDTLTKQFQRMIEIYNAIFDQKPSIGELFQVKRQ